MSVLIEAIKNVFSRPVTRDYPKERPQAFARFRGKIEYYPERCVGCGLCERKCPDGSIKFVKKGEVHFDLASCLCCGLCEDVCPGKAIKVGNAFEVASADKADLSV